MKSKKLKTLFIVLTAALAITGVNYAAGYNSDTAYAAESADIVSETQDADSAVTDVQDKAGKVDIKVSYNNESSTNSIDPVITVTNNSDEEMNLADLNLKYYYPSNTETNEVFACYYAGTVDGNYRSLTANVEGTLEKCAHIEDTADADANITFNGGTLDAGQSMTIQASIHKEDWTNYDVTDKSLCCISAYMNGKLVYEDGGREEVKDSEILNDYLGYTPEAETDLDINIKLNGNKLIGISDVTSEGEFYKLSEDKDYTVKYDEASGECVVTLKESFLKSRDNLVDLQFNFSKGNSQKISIPYCYPERPYHQFNMEIGSGEGNYTDDIVLVPVTLDSVDYYGGIASCKLHVKYDPDQVKVCFVNPSKLVNVYDNFKYEDDKENGQLDISYYDESLKDFSYLGTQAPLCYIAFQGRNGKMGSESELTLRGYGLSVRDNSQIVKFNSTVPGKVTFKGDEDVDLSMPVLERESYVNGGDRDIDIKINGNGNKFLGVEGLEEGTDYTFENSTLTLKKSMLEKSYKNLKEQEQDFRLDFSNGIKKVFTAINCRIGTGENFVVKVGGADAEKGSTVMIPIEISHNVYDVLTQCDFDLQYDTDIFEDAEIVCDDTNVESKIDSENGTVNVTYDKHDDSLSGDKIWEDAKGTQLKVNLALKVKADAPVGDTKVIFNSNKFVARNNVNYAAYVSRGTININK